MHGDEKQGYQVVIYTIKSIVENLVILTLIILLLRESKNIVNNTEMYFIPMINPGGIEAATRKNRKPNDCLFGDTLFRGIDLSRNFDYKWDDFDKHPLKYTLRSILIMGAESTVMYPYLDFFSIIGEGTYRGP